MSQNVSPIGEFRRSRINCKYTDAVNNKSTAGKRKVATNFIQRIQLWSLRLSVCDALDEGTWTSRDSPERYNQIIIPVNILPRLAKTQERPRNASWELESRRTPL